MKYFLFIFLLYPLVVYSQEIKIKKIKELKMQDSGEYLISGYLPDGNEILLTKAKYQGLYLYNLKKNLQKQFLYLMVPATILPYQTIANLLFTEQTPLLITKKQLHFLHTTCQMEIP